VNGCLHCELREYQSWERQSLVKRPTFRGHPRHRGPVVRLSKTLYTFVQESSFVGKGEVNRLLHLLYTANSTMGRATRRRNEVRRRHTR
jgi:hypothetical protein